MRRVIHRGAARWTLVGAGLTGMAAARRIAVRHPGDSVVLVDAQEVGRGGPGRNSGCAVVLPREIGRPGYLGDLAMTEVNAKHKHTAREIVKGRPAECSIDCQERAVGKYGTTVHVRHRGLLRPTSASWSDRCCPYSSTAASYRC
ncbi:FAD-dependent oxidoreductase [Paraburkholderia sp. J10-1]|uniref:FAD-dependent oxidoreductase n=1 Tax=Paraburkholderia sp. J10-1 TaxID=2805430 RepID=UPI0039EF96E7